MKVPLICPDWNRYTHTLFAVTWRATSVPEPRDNGKMHTKWIPCIFRMSFLLVSQRFSNVKVSIAIKCKLDALQTPRWMSFDINKWCHFTNSFQLLISILRGINTRARHFKFDKIIWNPLETDIGVDWINYDQSGWA